MTTSVCSSPHHDVFTSSQNPIDAQAQGAQRQQLRPSKIFHNYEYMYSEKCCNGYFRYTRAGSRTPNTFYLFRSVNFLTLLVRDRISASPPGTVHADSTAKQN